MLERIQMSAEYEFEDFQDYDLDELRCCEKQVSVSASESLVFICLKQPTGYSDKGLNSRVQITI